MERDNSNIINDKDHYENISEKISHMNDKLLEDRAKTEEKLKRKKKNKKREEGDMEALLLEKTFETEALSKEYLKIMYKEKTGQLPDEKEYHDLLEDMKSKGYIFSENGQPYEPKYDTSKTDEENFEEFRKEWGRVKSYIEDYLDNYLQNDYKKK